MDRRAFISTVGLGLAVPRVALAQPAARIYRIGYLGIRSPVSELAGSEPSEPLAAAFLRGLRELGYVYGEHFVTEVRSGEGKLERFPGLASELVRLKVDLIVTSGPALPAVKQATSTIPVVMIGAADPVAQGVAHSIGRPGGNFTGFSLQLVETTAKRLELLKELAPGAAPVAVLWDPRSGAQLSWRAAESAARARGWKLLSLEIKDAGEIEGAFKAATAARAGALLVLPGAVLDKWSHRIAELAIKSRLPAVYGLRLYVEDGGLMSYSPDLIDLWRRAAVVVDKILKGTRAGDLPFEQPTKFELVINLKAARSIGLAIPQSILARADEVIR
jgi:putative ABC transport system substrate-binding protein